MKYFKEKATTIEAVDTKADKLDINHHCAWCGDPPDQYGSHGICASHVKRLIEQAAARRRGRA